MNEQEFKEYQEFLDFKRFKAMMQSNANSNLQEETSNVSVKNTEKSKNKPKYTKRKDGRYATNVFVRYDDDGKRLTKKVYGKTIAELEAKVRELKEDIERGTDVLKKDMKFGEFREMWWIAKQTSIKTTNTKTMYKNIFTYITSLNNIDLKNIRTDHIQNIINNQINHPRTCQKIKMCLNEIFRKAIAERIIYYNPVDAVVFPSYKAKERRALSDDEWFLTELEIFEDMERAFVLIIKYCGLRKGEALALLKSDVDLDARRLTVSKALFKDVDQYKVKCTKNGFVRVVPIPDRIVNFLSYYISNLSDDKLFHKASKPNEYLSETLYKWMWGKIINKLKKEAIEQNMTIGDDLTAHIFRHNYACMLMDANVDMKERQYLLGHSSINVTMDIYTHIEDRKLNAPNLINKLLNNTGVVL